MVRINGEDVNAAGMSIAEYLEQAGFQTARVVVECNLEIIPKDTYGEVILKDGDTVEVLNFVGGG